MKKKIIISILILLSLSIIYADEKDEILQPATANAVDPDAITPASASFFLTVPKISRAIDFINLQNNNLNLSRVLFNNFKWIRLLKEKADMDVLNSRDLANAGIDTGRSMHLACLGYEKDLPETIFFLPVKDRKNFGFNMVKLFKRFEDNKSGNDYNPAISSYRDHRIFQVAPDILFTMIDDYFILTSSGELLSGVIDLKTEPNGSSLNQEAMYKDHKTKYAGNESGIAHIYIKKEFISKAYGEIKAVTGEYTGSPGSKLKINSGDRKKDNAKSRDGTDLKQADDLSGKFNFINYASLSLENRNDEVQINAGLSVNRDDVYGAFLLKTVTTGFFERALFSDNPVGYHFLSIDIKTAYDFINGIPGNNSDLLKRYNAFRKSGSGEFLEYAVLPCSKSFINIVLKKNDSTGEDMFAGYIPMKECGDIEKTLKVLKNGIKDKYSADGRFGEEKINGTNSFWFQGENGDKIYIAGFQGDIYAGNNTDFIGSVMTSSGKRSADIHKDFIKKTDKNTFLLSYSRFHDESFLKAILMMLAFKKDQSINSFINKIESLNLVGNKTDNYLLLNLNIKIMDSQ